MTVETPLSVPSLRHLATNSRTSALKATLALVQPKCCSIKFPFNFYHSVCLLYGSLLHQQQHQTPSLFPVTAMDQAHEQLNEQMKADGGIVGLTDNPTALLRWITAGPEVQQILHEFENSFKSTNEKPKLQHHDQTASFPRGRPQGRKFV